MFRSSAICAIFYFLTAATGSPPMGKHAEELHQLNEHVQYIAAFPCGVPQPKTFYMNDLGFDTRGKAYYPDVTVLHRCENTGCCLSNQVCAPKFSDKLDLPFKVTFLENLPGHRIGSWAMEYHALLNNTECCCVDLPAESDPPPLSGQNPHILENTVPIHPNIASDSPAIQHTEGSHQDTPVHQSEDHFERTSSDSYHTS